MKAASTSFDRAWFEPPLPGAKPGIGAILLRALPWVAAVLVLAAYVAADRENQLTGALVSAAVFALTPFLLPACRPLIRSPLCPQNWALLLFFLQLVVLPWSLLVVGPSLGVLPYMPSPHAINMAMLLNTVAFISFAAAYQYSAGSKQALSSIPPEAQSTTAAEPSPDAAAARKFARTCLGLGALGLLFAFHGVGGLVDYVTNPAGSVEQMAAASHTLAGLLGLLLRPFLGFGLVFLWCGWIDKNRGGRTPRWPVLTTLAAMLGVMASYATFGYNRGSFVVPLVAMLATIVARAKWISFRLVVSAGSVLALVLFLAPFLAVYRNSDLVASELIDDPNASDFFNDKIDLLMTVQMYGSGPQYGGFLLEASHWGTTPYLGSTLLPSVLAPLPFIGRPFRHSSGTEIYNRMVYGTGDILDQILPLSGEMFLNFHVPGVIVAFLILGAAASRLQRRFEQASCSIEVYIWQYAAIWILFLIMGSISILTQILFYFFWPVYGYFWWKRSAVRTAGAKLI